MSPKHATLGPLEFGPKTDDDPKKIFDRSVAGFWPAQHSQIYGTLSRLEQEALVTMNVVPQTGKPDRKVYNITDAGRAELVHWLRTAEFLAGSRSAFQVQVFFLGLLEEEEALEVLRLRAREFETRIAGLRARIPVDDEEATARSLGSCWNDFFTFLALDLGIERAEFYLQWVYEVIAEVERGDSARGALASFEHARPNASSN